VELAAPGSQISLSLTPDGTRLLFLDNFRDLSLFNLAQPDHLEPLLHDGSVNGLGQVSPDGKWVAYISDESGRFETFVRPFPAVSGRREKVSIDGGQYPLWGPKGDELFYMDLNGGMMAASVKLSPTLSLGGVTKLFNWEKPPKGLSGRPYDISPVDGRFLMVKPAAQNQGAPTEISVVVNWFEELRQRVPLAAR